MAAFAPSSSFTRHHYHETLKKQESLALQNARVFGQPQQNGSRWTAPTKSEIGLERDHFMDRRKTFLQRFRKLLGRKEAVCSPGMEGDSERNQVSEGSQTPGSDQASRSLQVSEIWHCVMPNCGEYFTDEFQWFAHEAEAHQTPRWICPWHEAKQMFFDNALEFFQHLTNVHKMNDNARITRTFFVRDISEPWATPMWCGYCNKSIYSSSVKADYMIDFDVNELRLQRGYWRERQAARRCAHIARHIEDGVQIGSWQQPRSSRATTLNLTTLDESQFRGIMDNVSVMKHTLGRMNQAQVRESLHQGLTGRWNRTSAIELLRKMSFWETSLQLKSLAADEDLLLKTLRQVLTRKQGDFLSRIENHLAGQEQGQQMPRFAPALQSTRQRASSATPSHSSQTSSQSGGSISTFRSLRSLGAATKLSANDETDVAQAIKVLGNDLSALEDRVKLSAWKIKPYFAKHVTAKARRDFSEVCETGVNLMFAIYPEAGQLYDENLALFLNRSSKEVSDALRSLTVAAWPHHAEGWSRLSSVLSETIASIQREWDAAASTRQAFESQGMKYIMQYPNKHFEGFN